MDYLYPILFPDTRELKEHIHDQLTECLSRILNEGAARGYTERFVSCVEKVGISVGEGDRFDGVGGSDDIGLIIGLLRWTTARCKGTYFTRSSRVFRVAACLAEVGFSFGPFDTWNGNGTAPRPDRSCRLVLVCGGTSETDPTAVEPEGSDIVDDFVKVHHYRTKTVGAMICNAFNDNSNLRPEPYQSTFDRVYQHLEHNLDFTWAANPLAQGGNKVRQGSTRQLSHISPKARWQPVLQKPSSVNVRLASLRFRRSAELLAPCYGPDISK